MLKSASQHELTTFWHGRRFEWNAYDDYAESLLRKDQLFDAILSSRAVERLRKIRFLGALDYFGATPLPSYRSYQNRYRHSVGVAHLAGRACAVLSATREETRLIVSAALVHDVGHGALSHSIEPSFKRKFDFCHKHIGARLITGDLFLGTELPEILQSFSVDPQSVASIALSQADHRLAFLFSHPINVDTVDAILRSLSFFSDELAVAPSAFLAALTDPSPRTMYLGDLFWRLKDTVYNKYIYGTTWSLYDYALQIALDDARARLCPEHFLLTDDDFATIYRSELDTVRQRMKNARELEYEISRRYKRPKRRFAIKQISVEDLVTAHERYAIERD